MSNHIARRLKVLRMQHGLTQRAVAQRMGMSHGKFWQIENGYTAPTKGEISKLARILKTSRDDLGLMERAS